MYFCCCRYERRKQRIAGWIHFLITTGDILKLKHVATKRECCVLHGKIFLLYKNEAYVSSVFDVLSEHQFDLRDGHHSGFSFCVL